MRSSLRDVTAGLYLRFVPCCQYSLKKFREAEGGKRTGTDVSAVFSSQLDGKAGSCEEICPRLKGSASK